MFLASDPLGFAGSLVDAGDGWTFRASEDGAWWVPGSVLFDVDGEPIAPEAVFPLAGRVSFPRNLRGRSVLATGHHYPTVCAATSTAWTLRVQVPLGDTTGIADETRTYDDTPGRTATATLDGCAVEAWLADSLAGARVLAQLPFQSGLMVGVGVASYGLADTSTVSVAFDEGEVLYVR